jgi:hypothetical protein
LRNRKRIWDIVDKNAELIQSHLRGIPLLGSPEDYTAQPGTGTDKELCSSISIISAEVTINDPGKPLIGSRPSFGRTVLLPGPREARLSELGVSFVSFNEQRYISGVRLLVLEGCATESQESYCLGYVDKRSEVVQRIASDKIVAGFDVAVRVGGVVRIRTVFGDDGIKTVSAWIGDIDNATPEVAMGTLLLEPTNKTFGLTANFDVSWQSIAVASYRL